MTIVQNVVIDDETAELLRMIAEDMGWSDRMLIRYVLRLWAKMYYAEHIEPAYKKD